MPGFEDEMRGIFGDKQSLLERVHAAINGEESAGRITKEVAAATRAGETDLAQGIQRQTQRAGAPQSEQGGGQVGFQDFGLRTARASEVGFSARREQNAIQPLDDLEQTQVAQALRIAVERGFPRSEEHTS